MKRRIKRREEDEEEEGEERGGVNENVTQFLSVFKLALFSSRLWELDNADSQPHVPPGSSSINRSTLSSTFISASSSPTSCRAVHSPPPPLPSIRPSICSSIHPSCTATPSQASLPRLHAGPHTPVCLACLFISCEGKQDEEEEEEEEEEEQGWMETEMKRLRRMRGVMETCCQEERDVERWSFSEFLSTNLVSEIHSRAPEDKSSILSPSGFVQLFTHMSEIFRDLEESSSRLLGPTPSHRQEHVAASRPGAEPVEQQEAEPVEQQEAGHDDDFTSTTTPPLRITTSPAEGFMLGYILPSASPLPPSISQFESSSTLTHLKTLLTLGLYTGTSLSTGELVESPLVSLVLRVGFYCGSRGRRGSQAQCATLDACRLLLADHLSYGDRWGNPLFARGGGLAAD
ncbi:unnamed protein product [Pleuronectes platessa]|uniref:Uncharacterized protein n=1 Tax=Pleuronectes platessa TaxID=8262 RepID=A0A9N7Y547_PLEPL|nr:unnamed protein product [Pleuronectes platessa]